MPFGGPLGKMAGAQSAYRKDEVGRHLHFDCFSGISGDMTLGALVDVGVPFSDLVQELKRLKLSGFTLRKRKVQRGALHATKVDVLITGRMRHPLPLRRIRSILAGSTLSDQVKRQSRQVFDRLADAEGHAHRVAKDHVHFHEVSVLDSFVDVVGALIGCELLDVTRVTASAINVGTGTLRSAHGILPAPGPAVAFLAKGIPIYSAGPSRELATPTGLALLRTLTDEFGPMPPMVPSAVGYGAGEADPDGWPNALRLFLSQPSTDSGRARETVVQLETNLDDVNPQTYEHIVERLFRQGALDVTLTPVIMKRGRPAIVLTALVDPERLDPALDVLFAETTALGVRVQEIARYILPRRFVSVKVQGGTVRMKIGAVDQVTTKAAPEYVDCKRIAEATGRPVKSVLEEAMMAYAAAARMKKGRS